MRDRASSTQVQADLIELKRLARLLRRVRRVKRSALALGLATSRMTPHRSRPRWEKVEEAMAPFDAAADRAFRVLRRRRRASTAETRR